MISGTFKGYLHLARPVNVVITLVAIPVACWLAGAGAADSWKIILAAITGALVTVGANAINDYFDIEIDRINKPERPLPSGVLSPREAWYVWLICSLFSILLNIVLNVEAFAIVFLAVVLLYFYSSRFKGTILFGNLIVGLMTGMAFIYGGIVVGTVNRSITPALFAFLTNVSREIVKDMEDIKGDAARQAQTLPVRLGLYPARCLVGFLILLLIVTTIIVSQLHIYTSLFIICLIPVDIAFMVTGVAVWFSSSSEAMHRLSVLLKICMAVGMIAIILGSLPW